VLVAIAVIPCFWVGFIVLAGDTAELSCDEGDCVVKTGYLWITFEETRFAAGDIIGSDESHNGSEVRVRLYHRDRSTIRLALDPFGGSTDFESIRAYLADPRGELSITATPSVFLWFMLVMGAVVMVGAGRSVFWFPSTIELDVRADAIDITERWPFRVRRRPLALDGPTEVRLLEQRTRTWLDGDIDGAIVQIVDADGRVRPITTGTYPHVEIHRAAADALRVALGLKASPEVPDDDDDDWDDDAKWADDGGD